MKAQARATGHKPSFVFGACLNFLSLLFTWKSKKGQDVPPFSFCFCSGSPGPFREFLCGSSKYSEKEECS